jgi:transposase
MKSTANSLENLSKSELIAALQARELLIENQLKQHNKQLAERDNIISILQEKLRLAGANVYGARSERRDNDPQADLFNEVDALGLSSENETFEAGSVSGEDTGSDAPSDDTQTITYERSRTRGRKALPESLPRVDIELDIPESDKVCACGCQKNRIGSDSSERLEIVPARLFVERHIRYKYACPKCEEGVQIAATVPAMIPKSNAGPGLLAYVVTAKYQDALPLHRQEKIFNRYGVELTRQTLANWIIKCSQALDPVLDQMERALRCAPVILMDETTVQVNKEDGKAASSKSYMWIRRALAPPDEDSPHAADITLYHYSRSRGSEVAAQLLDGYQGALMTDAYAGYNHVAASQHLVHAHCWAHARRKFVEAEKSLPKGKKSPAISAILNEIAKLYGVEKQIKTLSASDKQVRREALAKPVLEKLHQSLLKKANEVMPKSAFGEAVHYTLKCWSGLTQYLKNGHIPIDNNGAENGIRPFVIGRKNWMFCDTVNGAHASARLYSIIETAKANNLEPYQYLRHLFTELPKANCEADVQKLLPWRLDPATLH